MGAGPLGIDASAGLDSGSKMTRRRSGSEGRMSGAARLPRFVAVAGLTAASIYLPSVSLAQDNVEGGRAIAQTHCARCHAIAGPGPSPVYPAPPFSGFARKWPIDYLAEALAEGIVTGHGPVLMPVFVFTPEEIGDLLAYLKSVQE